MGMMIELSTDVYSIVSHTAKQEDCSISQAVTILIKNGAKYAPVDKNIFYISIDDKYLLMHQLQEAEELLSGLIDLIQEYEQKPLA